MTVIVAVATSGASASALAGALTGYDYDSSDGGERAAAPLHE